MKRNPLIPLLAILVVAFGGVLSTLITRTQPSLGLDLQGGASVVLQPDRSVDPAVLDRTIAVIRSRVDSIGVAEPEITRQGNAIVVQLPVVDNPARALEVVGKTAELRFRPVIQNVPSETDAQVAAALSTSTVKPGASTTVKPGASTTVKPGASTTVKPGASTTAAAGASTTGGVTTAPATTTATTTATTAPASSPSDASSPSEAPSLAFGQFSISAQINLTAAESGTTVATSVAPTSTATTAVAATAVTATTAKQTATTAKQTANASATTKPSATATTVKGAATTVVGATSTVAPTPTAPPVPTKIAVGVNEGKTTKVEDDDKDSIVLLQEDKRDPASNRFLLGPAAFTGSVKTARAETSDLSGWEVLVELNSKGRVAFNKLAEENCGKPVAIVLDGVVVSAPVINQPCSFPDGNVVITGQFTQPEAEGLATALKFGSLPVQLKPQTVQTVSATLGSDSLRAGIITGLIGLSLVCVYMLLYYRLLGFVVISGLMVSAALMWSVVTMLSRNQGLALSLSGAVGIIVSVGVTVDSYVVFFERMRDEIRSGKPMGSSVERGFKSAWRTILAADLTSFIGALVLYLRTVGSVRGFAFFLMISTALDIVVSYFFTRNVVTLIAKRKGFTGRSLGIYNAPQLSANGGSLTTGVLRPGAAVKSSSTVGGQS
jgi:preprotein translocase subunit SecD